MATRNQLFAHMVSLVTDGRCADNGEVNSTVLAEETSNDFGHNEWLDDSDHLVWHVALDVSDHFEEGPPDGAPAYPWL